MPATFSHFSEGESSWLHFQDYLQPYDFWSVLFNCRTAWYFWTEQGTLLHILDNWNICQLSQQQLFSATGILSFHSCPSHYKDNHGRRSI